MVPKSIAEAIANNEILQIVVFSMFFGVPRASLVVIAATLHQFNIPEAGLLLILGVDTFLDMGRSATNAVGNSIASAVVAKWEGELMPEAEAEANAARLDEEAEARMNEAAREADRVTTA
ncbi:hypothetical protein WS88_12460 [Burkholderia cepacia]|uniref:Sodium:dicarboxylate symporter n=1 Tax=Burkholderia cepacia TaxID=292 RepID=A0A103UM07_BURCE|nr:hypothetical protein WS88_12460 [Burkholderia cepacia]KVK85509.1 hypothetical protein WS90_08640 [Burkholderia cepacia]